MNTEPPSVLHRFVSLANEPDYLALGWMRERPLKPPVQNFGVWLIWPCNTCLPIEPHSGAVCGGWWPRCVPLCRPNRPLPAPCKGGMYPSPRTATP
jgi:hypothetical protein